MQAQFGEKFGCLDIFLLFALLYVGGNALSGDMFAVITCPMSLAMVGYLVWRRGWIQQSRHDQKMQEQLAREQQRLRAAERKQRSSPSSDTVSASSGSPDNPPQPPTVTVYRIDIPRTERLSAHQATGLMRALMKAVTTGFLELTLAGSQDRVHWEITHLPARGPLLTADELTAMVATYYPGAVVQVATLQLPLPLYRRYHIFEPKYTRYFDRALSIEDIRSDDPLARVARALTQLEDGETLRYTVTISSIHTPTEQELEDALTMSAYDGGDRVYVPMPSYRQKPEEALGSLAGSMAVVWWKNQQLKKERILRYSEAETKRYLEKLGQSLAGCVVSVTFDTPNKQRLNNLDHLFGAVQQLSGTEIALEPGYTSADLPITSAEDWYQRVPRQYLTDLAPEDDNDPDLISRYFLSLTLPEVAALWHLPHEGFDNSLLGIKGVQVPVPRSLTEVASGILLGNNRLGVRVSPVYQPQADRTAHTALIGKTGRGKSSLMHQMLHQDIAAGRGVCLIDPTGALVSDVLQHSIPPEREDDVLVLDISTAVDGTFYPPPMNVFLSGSLEADMAARRLLSIFNILFDNFENHKMADTLNMALMTLYHKDRPSLLDLHCLFNNAEYRAQLVDRVSNLIVRDYWAKFEAAKESKQASDAEPVLWRLRSFYNNERLQSITCHPDRLNLAKLIRENKIILVSLGDPDERMPEQERFVLGAALIAQIEMAARSGAVTNGPYLLYIDEVQEFVRTSLPRMLSQLRKHGLGMVIANQYFAQLFGDTFQALEGTVSTLIAFEVGKSDATALAPYMQPGFTANDLVALGKYKAAVSMVDEQGVRQPGFSLETVPPPGLRQSNHEREAYLRRKSVENFRLKPYDEVLTWIRQSYDCSQPISNRPPSSVGEAPAGDTDDFFE